MSRRVSDPRFKILIASPPEYEDVVAEIYIDDRYVGLLSADDGPHMLRFDVATDPDPLKLDLDVFERALAAAKARLLAFLAGKE